MATTASMTTPFKASAELQTKAPSTRSVTSSLPDAVSNASEERYWAEKFGLGAAQTPAPQYAHYRQVKLNAGSSSIVHQLLFGSSSPKSKLAPLVTVCGPRVQIYGTTPQSLIHRTLAQHSVSANRKEVTVDPDRKIQTGGHLALAASFRNDGRLLAIATHNGQIRVADTTSRATLCTWQTKRRLPVRSVHWFRDGQHVLVSSDDGLLSVWQLKQQGAVGGDIAPTIVCAGHGDVVRCAALWQLPAKTQHSWPVPAIAASGSYDHTVRLWRMDDLREANQDRCLAVLSHGSPVEAVLWMRSSDPLVPVWLLSAGGTTIKVWNPLSGLCVSITNTQHRKTITCLLFAPRKDYIENTVVLHNRVLTGSIDGLLRVHAWDDKMGKLQHLHGIDLHVPITSMAISANADRLAVATMDGTVFVRQRGPSVTEHKRKREPMAGTFAFFTRGMNVEAASDDYVVATGKKRKLQKFDLALKQFRYGDALDESLETRNPQAVVAVLEELGKRRGLTIALSNRDEESLEPILSFTVRYICRPRFSALLIGVANKLIDIYGVVAGQSETIDELFVKLKKQVSAECKMQKALMHVVGQLDAIMASVELCEPT
jgi:U3 small nucleolar RNA-associated protein 15